MKTQTIFSCPISSRISGFAPSNVPKIRHPFMENFIIPVPDASLPGVLHTKSHTNNLLNYYYLYPHYAYLNNPQVNIFQGGTNNNYGLEFNQLNLGTGNSSVSA